jgi:hypothetical protein
VAGSVADLKDAFSRCQGKLVKADLADRPFAEFGHEIIDATDLCRKTHVSRPSFGAHEARWLEAADVYWIAFF